MALSDSIDKIVSSYFQVIATKPFTYKRKTYEPKGLIVSKSLVRDFTCPENCGACCSVFTLDYLPEERKPEGAVPRIIKFDGRDVQIFSDIPDGTEKKHCKKINMLTARCSIHGYQPFSCDFELIRTSVYADPKFSNRIGQRLYGRGWAMTQCCGEKGIKCKMLDPSLDSVAEARRKIVRLQQWADHFGIEHRCQEILDWLDNYAHDMKSTLGL